MDRLQIDNIERNSVLYKETISKLMANGVIFKSIDNVRISPEVQIGSGTVIDRDNDIMGHTVIGECVQIGVGNSIDNAVIGSNATLIQSQIKDSKIGANTTVGPYANVHTRSVVARDCRIGNFVEIKNSNIGIGTKMAHLAYIGDADIGDKCNIGCGAIFINYDGKNKHRSRIGDSVFVGSNSNIVAPVIINNNAFIAAGTTVTVDLPQNSMCIGRKREIIKENRSKYRMCDYNKKYFGTDGIRGIFGKTLNEKLAYMVGNFLGYSSDRGNVVIGRDTRLSGSILASALTQGITDAGANVIDLSITSTPSVAYITDHIGANYGVMITASHNPPEYNGIKIFNSKGIKLTNIEETEIENHIDKDCPYTHSEQGKVISGGKYIDEYVSFLTGIVNDMQGIKIVLDCSNGGISEIAEKVFDRLSADYVIINNKSDGISINENCGALHTEVCAKAVLSHKADIGYSFDGDADRVLALDSHGRVIDGDKIIYIIAKYLRSQGKLSGDTVVGTIMTNSGVERSLNDCGITLERTPVGDHYVADVMLKNGYLVGGEQSGHIILREYENTGDGLLAALYLCKIIKEYGRDISELADCAVYPQHNINLITDKKKEIATDSEVAELVQTKSAELNGGRIVLRASGTEPKLRITAECEDIDKAKQICETITSFIRDKYDL